MIRILILAAAAWSLFVGCAVADTLSDAKAELGCNEAFTQQLPSFRIANNAWNKPRAGTHAVRQCIRIRDGAHGPEYGWSWDWPAESDTLLSFPQVIFGWKPWDGGASSHPELPIQITAIDKLHLSYAVETRATGKHNLATTLWLTRSGVTGAEPNPKDISTDLMIWTDGFAFDPFGTQVGRTSIDGLDFEVWLARDLGDDSADGPRWNYVAYRSTSKHLGASLDLNAFLRHAVEQGFVSSDHYVSDVEVGNEIMSGVGETWIKAIDLDVERRTRAAQRSDTSTSSFVSASLIQMLSRYTMRTKDDDTVTDVDGFIVTEWNEFRSPDFHTRRGGRKDHDQRTRVVCKG